MCCVLVSVFFVKQKTAYEMRISDWSSDVCSSDLSAAAARGAASGGPGAPERPGEGLGRGKPSWQETRASASRGSMAGLGARACRRHRRRLDRVVVRWNRAAVPSDHVNPIYFNRVKDRKSVVSGKSVSVRVDLGCSRIIKKKTQ